MSKKRPNHIRSNSFFCDVIWHCLILLVCGSADPLSIQCSLCIRKALSEWSFLLECEDRVRAECMWYSHCNCFMCYMTKAEVLLLLETCNLDSFFCLNHYYYTTKYCYTSLIIRIESGMDTSGYIDGCIYLQDLHSQWPKITNKHDAWKHGANRPDMYAAQWSAHHCLNQLVHIYILKINYPSSQKYFIFRLFYTVIDMASLSPFNINKITLIRVSI